MTQLLPGSLMRRSGMLTTIMPISVVLEKHFVDFRLKIVMQGSKIINEFRFSNE